MSSDKRRRARVQGGWAASTATGTGNTRSSVARGVGVKSTPQIQARNTSTTPSTAPHNIPAWYGKTVDVPEAKQSSIFVYEVPTEEIREEPTMKVIEKTGVYDISCEPSGISRIRLFPNYIETAKCAEVFEQLLHELPWEQRSDVKNGISYQQPRLTAWFGDLPYSYSGVTLQPNPNWTPALKELKENIEENTGCHFNSMLANLYRDGRDTVPWHADDEPSLGRNPVIASLSFGDLRNFELRRKPPPGADPQSYVSPEYVKVPLDAGSLLIMEGCTQADWQHRVPKEYHDRGPRINLTFRVIYTDPQQSVF